MPNTLPMTSFPLNPVAWLRAPALLHGVADAAELLAPTLPALPLRTDHDARLGRLFENLVADAVAASPALTLVTRNLVIHDGQRTLGELDMLVHDSQRDVLMHWEVTLKFYFGMGPDNWPGPDPRDTLAKKHARTLHHQLPLLHHPATRALLAAQGWAVTEQRLFSRGMLCYTESYAESYAESCADNTFPSAPPAQAAPGHLRGRWWALDHLPPAGQFLPLPKSAWLNAAQLSDNSDNWLARPAIIDYVLQQNRPVMVLWRPQPEAASTPGFIIPPGQSRSG
ncbi:DUF1853 family protein [Alcanivorax sp. JB21]|uniref:DUF1853 family protein n=1 Tax=Alcanivorax limicola TaxID=2874102 RepID=UPI001CC08D69|nr:DUF1853 family protein [Alcanivorax limicola]MBZ2188208.1 DUF1853 family protein [Alcanivorax limicola]